jgi:molybdenum-dependent DNA-binding transcriptional regulator ModE
MAAVISAARLVLGAVIEKITGRPHMGGAELPRVAQRIVAAVAGPTERG